MFWLRALYVSNGLAVGSLYGFVPVLLQSKGFDPALVGLTTSLGSFAYTLALPAWGHMGDIISGPRRALQLSCIPAAIFALGLGAPLPVFAIIICQMVLSAGGGPAMALTDAMAVPELKDPEHEYSRLRLLSSSGAAGGSIVFGLLYGVTGYLAAPVVYLGVMALTLISVQFVRLGRDSERHRIARGEADARPAGAPERGRFGSVGEALASCPRLFAVMLSVTVVFVGVMAASTYMSLRISDLGGGPAEVGLTNGIAMGAEVPGLVLAGWLIGRIGARALLGVGTVGFAVCMTTWIVLADAAPILITRFISGFFFSAIFVAFVLTISTMLPQRLQSTGMTLFQAGCFGLGAILANLLGGVLYQAAGAFGVFGGGAICCVAGGLIGVFALPSRRLAPLEDAEAAAMVPMSLAG